MVAIQLRISPKSSPKFQSTVQSTIRPESRFYTYPPRTDPGCAPILIRARFPYTTIKYQPATHVNPHISYGKQIFRKAVPFHTRVADVNHSTKKQPPVGFDCELPKRAINTGRCKIVRTRLTSAIIRFVICLDSSN